MRRTLQINPGRDAVSDGRLFPPWLVFKLHPPHMRELSDHEVAETISKSSISLTTF